ncbi:MAG TPA: cupredoxin domain-containing protein [Mycobacterium sp.]|jgi:plastocyanin
MNTSPKSAAALVCTAILLVAACGQSAVSNEQITTTAPIPTSSAGPPKPPAPAAATITIQGFEFSNATVAPGGQVTVANLDGDAHTVTSNTSGQFSVDVGGKSKAVFSAPNKPGSYPFHCEHHASMHGMLTVQ